MNLRLVCRLAVSGADARRRSRDSVNVAPNSGKALASAANARSKQVRTSTVVRPVPTATVGRIAGS